jgi:hypothetical protein
MDATAKKPKAASDAENKAVNAKNADDSGLAVSGLLFETNMGLSLSKVCLNHSLSMNDFNLAP